MDRLQFFALLVKLGLMSPTTRRRGSFRGMGGGKGVGANARMLVSQSFAAEVFGAAYRARIQHNKSSSDGRGRGKGYGYIEFAHFCIAMRIICESLDPSVASVFFPNQVKPAPFVSLVGKLLRLHQRENWLFSAFSVPDLFLLAEHIKVCAVGPGETLCREGEDVTSTFLLLGGQLEGKRRASEKGRSNLLVLPGDWVALEGFVVSRGKEIRPAHVWSIVGAAPKEVVVEGGAGEATVEIEDSGGGEVAEVTLEGWDEFLVKVAKARSTELRASTLDLRERIEMFLKQKGRVSREKLGCVACEMRHVDSDAASRGGASSLESVSPVAPRSKRGDEASLSSPKHPSSPPMRSKYVFGSIKSGSEPVVESIHVIDEEGASFTRARMLDKLEAEQSSITEHYPSDYEDDPTQLASMGGVAGAGLVSPDDEGDVDRGARVDFAAQMHDLAVLEFDLENIAGARSHLARAISIRTEIFGAYDPVTMSSVRLLEKVNRKQKRQVSVKSKFRAVINTSDIQHLKLNHDQGVTEDGTLYTLEPGMVKEASYDDSDLFYSSSDDEPDAVAPLSSIKVASVKSKSPQGSTPGPKSRSPKSRKKKEKVLNPLEGLPSNATAMVRLKYLALAQQTAACAPSATATSPSGAKSDGSPKQRGGAGAAITSSLSSKTKSTGGGRKGSKPSSPTGIKVSSQIEVVGAASSNISSNSSGFSSPARLPPPKEDGGGLLWITDPDATSPNRSVTRDAAFTSKYFGDEDGEEASPASRFARECSQRLGKEGEGPIQMGKHKLLRAAGGWSDFTAVVGGGAEVLRCIDGKLEQVCEEVARRGFEGAINRNRDTLVSELLRSKAAKGDGTPKACFFHPSHPTHIFICISASVHECSLRSRACVDAFLPHPSPR